MSSMMSLKDQSSLFFSRQIRQNIWPHRFLQKPGFAPKNPYSWAFLMWSLGALKSLIKTFVDFQKRPHISEKIRIDTRQNAWSCCINKISSLCLELKTCAPSRLKNKTTWKSENMRFFHTNRSTLWSLSHTNSKSKNANKLLKERFLLFQIWPHA